LLSGYDKFNIDIRIKKA